MRKALIILVAVLALAGCSNTPDNVIGEGDMVDVLVDMHRAEALIQMNSGKYYNDSIKKTLKQSVLMKYGYTQADFDTSLVWYGHHIDRYVKIYDKVIARLQKDERAAEKEQANSPSMANAGNGMSSRKRYGMAGDTIDLWNKGRSWVMMPNMGRNCITFDYKPVGKNRRGDRYKLSFKLMGTRSSMKVYFGIDYTDGSTAFLFRSLSYEGWNDFTLQCDTLRTPRRIYGYMAYKPGDHEVVYVDSIEILRTHLDRSTYQMINAQRWMGRKSLLQIQPKVPVSVPSKVPVAPKPEAVPASASRPSSIKGGFTPKPGLNKSSVAGHVGVSPNGTHLPQPQPRR